MSYAQLGSSALDYQPCQYPGSPMTFRGPKTDMDGGFILCLGGSETFGKFSSDPFPGRLGDRLGRRVINMGAMNAGVDLFLHDGAVKSALRQADAVVLQVPGAANMSNRFFTVHARRNDRFLKASTMLRTIFREVDFTEFHFTRHMLSALKLRSPERFDVVVEELRTAWVARMSQIIRRTEVPVHLLWLSHRAPSDELPQGGDLGYDPLFVTATMLDDVTPLADSLTVTVWKDGGQPPHLRGLAFGKGEEAAAHVMPGPADHETVSRALAEILA